MSKFIRLSECVGQNKTFPIILNTSLIDKITVANRGTDTHILLKDESFIFVRESLDEVWRMLNGVLPLVTVEEAKVYYGIKDPIRGI